MKPSSPTPTGRRANPHAPSIWVEAVGVLGRGGGKGSPVEVQNDHSISTVCADLQWQEWAAANSTISSPYFVTERCIRWLHTRRGEVAGGAHMHDVQTHSGATGTRQKTKKRAFKHKRFRDSGGVVSFSSCDCLVYLLGYTGSV
jgi:hypothetical protein